MTRFPRSLRTRCRYVGAQAKEPHKAAQRAHVRIRQRINRLSSKQEKTEMPNWMDVILSLVLILISAGAVEWVARKI